MYKLYIYSRLSKMFALQIYQIMGVRAFLLAGVNRRKNPQKKSEQDACSANSKIYSSIKPISIMNPSKGY